MESSLRTKFGKKAALARPAYRELHDAIWRHISAAIGNPSAHAAVKHQAEKLEKAHTIQIARGSLFKHHSPMHATREHLEPLVWETGVGKLGEVYLWLSEFLYDTYMLLPEIHKVHMARELPPGAAGYPTPMGPRWKGKPPSCRPQLSSSRSAFVTVALEAEDSTTYRPFINVDDDDLYA